jgi:uncharacterized protein (DUF58 family)
MDKKNQTFAFLNPEHIVPIKNLELRARLIVEGTIAGMHQSPYHGFSTEFLEYRPYLPGESTRRIDWRKFAKTDRAVVRLFEDETNLYANILIDKSASMRFASTKTINKYDYARTLAASLALILVRQRDAVGLSAFDETMSFFIAPHSTNIQLKTILAQLDRMEASGATRCGAALSRLAQTLKKRGLCIVISDLFDDPEEIIRGLRHLRFKKQDVIVLRVADPMEWNFNHTASLKLHDLETGETLSLDPVTAARFFNRGVAGHHAAVKKACRELAIDCELILTNEPFHKALVRVLDKRRKMP